MEVQHLISKSSCCLHMSPLPGRQASVCIFSKAVKSYGTRLRHIDGALRFDRTSELSTTLFRKPPLLSANENIVCDIAACKYVPYFPHDLHTVPILAIPTGSSYMLVFERCSCMYDATFSRSAVFPYDAGILIHRFLNARSKIGATLLARVEAAGRRESGWQHHGVADATADDVLS